MKSKHNFVRRVWNYIGLLRKGHPLPNWTVLNIRTIIFFNIHTSACTILLGSKDIKIESSSMKTISIWMTTLDWPLHKFLGHSKPFIMAALCIPVIIFVLYQTRKPQGGSIGTIVPILQICWRPEATPVTVQCTGWIVFIFVFEVLALLPTLYSLVVGFR